MCAELPSNNFGRTNKKERILYVSVDSSAFSPLITDLPERRQEGFANLSPSPKNRVAPPPKSCDRSEWPRDFGIPMYYLKM